MSGSFWCNRSIPMRPGGHPVRSCALGPFPGTVVVVPVRSVHSHAPWGSSCSLVCLLSIHAFPWGRRIYSGPFGLFPCTLVHSRAPCESSGSFGCVWYIPLRPGSPFPCALGVVALVRIHSRALLWSSSSFVCGRSIRVRHLCRRVRSGTFSGSIPVHSVGRQVGSGAIVHSSAPWWPSGSFGCVLSISVCHRCHRVRLGVFGPFLCAPWFIGFVRVRSVHFRALLGSKCAFRCVRSFRVRSVGRRVRSDGLGLLPYALGSPGSFGCVRPFQCALAAVLFVRMLLVLSRAPWVPSGSFGYIVSISVHPACRRVRLSAFGSFPCDLGFGRVHSGGFGAFPCDLLVVELVGVRLGVWRSFGCIRVRPWS